MVELDEGSPPKHKIMGAIFFEGRSDKTVFRIIGERVDRDRGVKVFLSAPGAGPLSGMGEVLKNLRIIVSLSRRVSTVVYVIDIEKVGLDVLKSYKSVDPIIEIFASNFITFAKNMGLNGELIRIHGRIVKIMANIRSGRNIDVYILLNGDYRIPSIELHILNIVYSLATRLGLNNVLDRLRKYRERREPCIGGCLRELKRILASTRINDYRGYKGILKYVIEKHPSMIKKEFEHFYNLLNEIIDKY